MIMTSLEKQGKVVVMVGGWLEGGLTQASV